MVSRHKIVESDLLMIHERCKKFGSPKEGKSAKYKELFHSLSFDKMRNDFSQRNGIKNEENFTIEHMYLLKSLCCYEQAIYQQSPWCSLFKPYERFAFNYLDDIKSYTDAYGMRI